MGQPHNLVTLGSRFQGSLPMRNLSNPPQQSSKCQNRAEEIEKCLNDGFETTLSF